MEGTNTLGERVRAVEVTQDEMRKGFERVLGELDRLRSTVLGAAVSVAVSCVVAALTIFLVFG